MKYLQGKRGYNIALREKELPKPEGNMVLVKTLACGVCGSDIHILERMEEYTPMGHEISAVVTEVGACVTKVQPGDHVIAVSYTHLDVYKRQGLRSALHAWAACCSGLP